MITMFLTFEHHKKECALAHSRAERGRLRIIGTLVPFCVIGNSKEFPITQKGFQSIFGTLKCHALKKFMNLRALS